MNAQVSWKGFGGSAMQLLVGDEEALSSATLRLVLSISICGQATFGRHITMHLNLYETWILTNGLKIWSTQSHLASFLFLMINLLRPESVGEGPGQALC